MKFGIVVFPGSNCDDDMFHVLGDVLGAEVLRIWHKDTSLKDLSSEDCIILPGGFSFGDYLRAGAIARFAPVMKSIIDFANKGGMLMGICNGFQILCEAGLLPGVLLRNANEKFVCKNVFLKVGNNETPLTACLSPSEVIKIPVAHADGRYHTDPRTLAQLEQNGQILFRYCDKNGIVNEDTNLNGSIANIAGICDENRRIFGMMPHPERASESVLGNTDGLQLFESLVSYQSILATP